MKSFFSHLIRKPTFISVIATLFFAYVLFLMIYKIFNPPKIGSAYNMILETLLIISIVPLILFVIDRLLVMKINNIKLAIIEAILIVGLFSYYFLFVNPF
jgi:hypothetical protein